MPELTSATCLVTKIQVPPSSKQAFVDWQSRLNACISSYPGFISLEILASQLNDKPEWVIVQRFQHPTQLSEWRNSEEHNRLYADLRELIVDIHAIMEEERLPENIQGGITEVFVTQVSPESEKIYRQWIAKMHQAEARFPGFRGCYVQSPSGEGHHWITLLQFDTIENLERWLKSPERKAVLDEGKPLIASLESHRVISPYAGWFVSIAKEGELPPVWKQTMMVLLVLFPIVMLELKFLTPLTANLNPSVGTFIGNAISVILVSWPLMPIAIWFLGWWLAPSKEKSKQTMMLGTAAVFGLYLIEIGLLWNLLG